MSDTKEAKHSNFQFAIWIITIFVTIILAGISPILKGALGDIKSNEKRLDGLTTQQALTKQNRVYMQRRFNGLDGRMENLHGRMENLGDRMGKIAEALNNFIISYDEKGRLVGHNQPKTKRSIL